MGLENLQPSPDMRGIMQEKRAGKRTGAVV